MVHVDITAQGSWGAHSKVQPCTHTQPQRRRGSTGWPDVPREGTAHKRVSTQPSQTTHPALVAGEATLWGEGSGGPRGQQQQRQQQAEGQHLAGWLVLLSSSGAAHPAWQPLKPVLCGLESLLCRLRGIFSAQPAAVFFCFFVFFYICLSKACTPSPLTFKWWRTSLSNQCPQKCFRTGFNPFIKTSALFLCQEWICSYLGMRVHLPRSSTSSQLCQSNQEVVRTKPSDLT